MAQESERAPDYKSQGEQVGLGITEPVVLTRVGKAALNTIQEAASWLIEFILKNAGRFVVFLARSIARGEDKADPVFRDLANAAIFDLTGADAKAGNAAIGRQLLEALTGGAGAAPGGQLSPSTAGAEAYMEMVMKLALEGYLEGSLIESLSLGYLKAFGELDDILANVLGLQRATRAVMRPILNAKVVVPTTWAVNRTYRPNLLGAGEIARQVARGRMTKDAGVEELARQGYSNDRIEALLNAVAKFHSVADVYLLVKSNTWSRDEGVKHLGDQGYDPDVAARELTIERLKAIASFERSMATAAVDAFADGRVDAATLADFTIGVTLDNQEGAQLRELAHAKRALRIQPLTAAEARRCVLKGILAVPDYRAALRREGRDEDAVLALELELRADLHADAKVDALRTAALAERAAEKAAKDKAAKDRRAEIEQQRMLARRGPISELARAVVRGLIPIARFEEVLAAQYDADTVQIFVDDVELQRLDYLAQQEAADAARRRAAVRSVSEGDLAAAVLAGALTLDDYRRMLGTRGFSVADVTILSATLAARVADQVAATKKRAEAELAAKRRSIDLGRFETLVRRGVRSFADYAALLSSLGFDDAAQADLADLLQLKMADDQAARELREQAHTDAPAKGLSLDAARRAVVLGLLPIDAFERYLIDAGYTTDAQTVLLAELRVDVADADAARARRNQTELPAGAPGVQLATIRRAARLGIVAPDVYVARLTGAGWSADDIAIELELLLQEIADVQAVRAVREQAPAPAGEAELTLAQLAAAVKRGFKTLADFQSRAVVLGLSNDAISTQLRVLGDELEETKAAKARRDALVKELDASAVPIAELEIAVRAGQLTLADFTATLQQKGLAPVDAALLAGLLEAEL